ncbi:putative repeat protein (TIGR03847 family) [Lentzea atacamensis]|uniref:Repeat protein (TIGR03847 family) n=2 Tax=Lentzea TaxID=165301 RepID=A0ABX9EJ77_9PSEU|nr:putative repeat protein (TIGR03847 family) [Lentzea atacamensis]
MGEDLPTISTWPRVVRAMARVIHVFRAPDRFVAGTVGQPGDRTFYLQASEQSRLISVALEKQQVQVLAERIGSLLEEVHRRFGTDVPDDAPPDDLDTEPLDVPVEEEFRVGTMGLGWDAESKAVVIELLAISEEEVDEAVVLDDTEEGPDAVRVFLSPSAARAFAERADRVVNAGRKPCPLCAEPLDPDGHICPRQNGYRRSEED